MSACVTHTDRSTHPTTRLFTILARATSALSLAFVREVADGRDVATLMPHAPFARWCGALERTRYARRGGGLFGLMTFAGIASLARRLVGLRSHLL